MTKSKSTNSVLNGCSAKIQRCRSLIFSHLSEARDGVTLVRSLAHALFKNKVKPDHVIFTTYQEKEDDSIGKQNSRSFCRS
jgi:folylpolyglutamate synthase